MMLHPAPLRCSSVDFSGRFVLAGKCHATLSALPASPSATHCLSLAPSTFLSDLARNTEDLPSPLFTSYHMLCSPRAASLRCYGAESLQTFPPRSKLPRMATNHKRRSEMKRRPKINCCFLLSSPPSFFFFCRKACSLKLALLALSISDFDAHAVDSSITVLLLQLCRNKSSHHPAAPDLFLITFGSLTGLI